MRATSPKLRVDEARGGSLNSPEPVGADSAKKDATAPAAALFRSEVDAINQWVRNRLSKLVRLPAKPDSFSSVCFAHWNGLAVEADNQHGPLIHVQATICATSSSGKCPTAKLSHPIARAESASACQACPMSCKQYRYARSPYFHASRQAIASAEQRIVELWIEMPPAPQPLGHSQRLECFSGILSLQHRAQERETQSYEARNETFRPIPSTLLAREVLTFEEKRTM